ncbi:ISKra4 family transposase, partial [Acaryochloris marina NIES-2412]
HQAEQLLWQGKVDGALALFESLKKKQAQVFCNYVRKHRHRIVNYDYYQSEQICSIGSGAVESAIKQISRRVKISGAQWNANNVPQVLAHRCAYLNGLIGMQR